MGSSDGGMLMIARLLVLCFSALMLSGCVTTGPASIKGGECRIFERPQYAVRGLRQYDQDWIDSQVEGGVGGCRWKRPAARPPSFDAVQGQRAKAPPVKKRGFMRRIKDRVVHPFTKRVAPIEETPLPPVVVAPTPAAPQPPAPPPKPRDPVDELLQPYKDQRRFN